MKEPIDERIAKGFLVDDELRIPVKMVKTARFLDGWIELVRVVLARHHCTLDIGVEYCQVVFPEGTYKSELFPRVGSSRFLLVLPDGTELIEVVQRDGSSLLGFNKTEYPPLTE